MVDKWIIHSSWQPLLQDNDEMLYEIIKALPKNVSPHPVNIFNSFKINLNDVKLVVVGQDPYPNISIATGYAFAVPKGRNSKSLDSIREAAMNYGIEEFDETLQDWKDKGVMLYNSALTVMKGDPGSHAKLWRPFSRATLKFIHDNNKQAGFALLGNPAKVAATHVLKKDRTLQFVHPNANYYSHKQLFNEEFFEKTNQYVNWKS